MKAVVRCILASMTVVLATPLAAQRQQSASASEPPVSPQAQLALDELSPRFAREIELIQGWFRDRPVAYYNFGYVNEPVATGLVLWPIHGFDAKGNPVAMRGQRPIFSTVPPLSDYSGIWRLAYVITADHVQPNQLRDPAAVDALIRSKRASLKETNVTLNLPIVPRGSRLARDSTPPMMGWYQGRDVQFFDFGVVDATPTPMWRFSKGLDSIGQPKLLVEQNSIVDSIPVAGPYPDLWVMRVVRTDESYTPNTLRNLVALQSANMTIDPPNGVRNLPITMVDGAPVHRAPSPIRAFADLRSPFPPAPTRPQ